MNSRKMSAPLLHLVPDSDSYKQFTEWMQNEEPTVLFHLDSGVYGRPITHEGVVRAYREEYPRRFDQRFPFREGTLVACNSFYARLTCGMSSDASDDAFRGEMVGHVDCLVVDSPALGGRVGWLFMVYILPTYRGHGWGKALVMQALTTFIGACEKVYLMVNDENPAAKRCYTSIGFEVESQQQLPGSDVAVDIMTINVPTSQ